jgi:TRAF3-interacting protein 1
MYTQLFNKPPMTEKLLSKPPFKYLFDVVVALIGKTNFAAGLYADGELDPSVYQVFY